MRKFLTNCPEKQAGAIIDKLKFRQHNRVIEIGDPVPAEGTNSTVESLKAINYVGIYEIVH